MTCGVHRFWLQVCGPLLGLAGLTTLFPVNAIGAAAATLPTPNRDNPAPLLAVNSPAVKAGKVADDSNSDADDGTVASAATGVTFGRALNLQGTPLSLRSAKVRIGVGGLFASGLYAGPFVRPTGLPVRASSISSGFGTRLHPLLGGYRFHAGIDLVAPAGTQILATSPGLVAEAGWCGGYGFCVTVDHGDGYHTLYGHLSRVDVTPGERVSSGQRLGLVGSTGQSTGPHLHYEVRINGHPVDPQPYLR